MTIKTNYFSGSYFQPDLIASQKSLFTDGVYEVASGAFAASEHSPANLSVNIAVGALQKNGYYVNSDAIVNPVITANTSGYNRKDIIVANLDTSGEVTSIIAVVGTPSSTPTAPLPTADQLLLHDVFVGNNVSVINTANITDKRVECGKANINQPAWLTPTFLNGWTTSNGAGYMKDTLGFVHLKGYVSGGTLATSIFMPSTGYKPIANAVFVVTANNAFGRLAVFSSGDIQLLTGALTNVSLDGITYRAEL